MEIAVFLIVVILLVNSAWIMAKFDKVIKLLESIESQAADKEKRK